ncbi:hypothetical protein ACQ4WY_21285 [Janthinobacterium sp. LB2P49]|uniref:hypothetical protein n=1 Tax=Janthinobacterium sp. LB2P49 TaxID=3424198 RepID=UPI003F22F5BC
MRTNTLKDAMKIPEMLNLIKSNNIPDDAYSINRKLQDESLCMKKNDNFLEIFYYERGIKTSIHIFKNEDEACEYFMKKLNEWFEKK